MVVIRFIFFVLFCLSRFFAIFVFLVLFCCGISLALPGPACVCTEEESYRLQTVHNSTAVRVQFASVCFAVLCPYLTESCVLVFFGSAGDGERRVCSPADTLVNYRINTTCYRAI